MSSPLDHLVFSPGLLQPPSHWSPTHLLCSSRSEPSKPTPNMVPLCSKYFTGAPSFLRLSKPLNTATELHDLCLAPKDCPASSPTIPSSHWERLSIPPASRPFALTVPSAWNALSFPLVYSCWTNSSSFNCWFKGHLLQRPPLDLDSISSFIVCSPVKSASPISEFSLLPVALYLMSVS